MASDTVSYFVDPRFQARSGAIAATLEQLLEIGGWAATRVDQPASAHITYSPDREVAHGLPAVLPEVWVDSSRAIPVAIDGHLIPSTAIVGADTGGVEFDLVHAAHFFLGGAHEDATDVREPGQDIPGRGVAKWGFLDRPGIAALVASMSAFVAARPGTPAPRARWPAGKSWALALTHDCDRLRRYRVRDFWREARTDVDRREWTRACFDAAKAAYALPLSYVCRDPYEESLRSWVAFERELGIRSAFYIGVWSRTEAGATPSDFPYSCEDKRVQATARWLHDQGWEIGLHSGILAWSSSTRFAEEARRFESCYGTRARGFRAHYWSLEPGNPAATLAHAAADARLEYDTSFGMNKVHGFRRGMSYPYRPFDGLTGKYSGLWEIPPTMMDESLFLSARTNEARLASFDRHIDCVRKHRGAAVLDWHSDSLFHGYMADCTRPVMQRIRDLAADSTCWVATPADMLNWCRRDRWNGSGAR